MLVLANSRFVEPMGSLSYNLHAAHHFVMVTVEISQSEANQIISELEDLSRIIEMPLDNHNANRMELAIVESAPRQFSQSNKINL